MDHIPLFAPNIFYTKVENKTILNEINNFSKTEKYQQLQNAGDRNLSDSGLDMRVLEKMPNSKSYLMSICDNVLQNTLKYPCQFQITTSWFTRAKKNCESEFHNHRNCFYSGILYFGEYDEKTAGEIQFVSPMTSFFNYDIAPTEWNIFNSHNWSIKPQHGLILIFPSFLFHKIKSHGSKNIRRSLAFNVIPVGEYGLYDSAYKHEWVKT